MRYLRRVFILSSDNRTLFYHNPDIQLASLLYSSGFSKTFVGYRYFKRGAPNTTDLVSIYRYHEQPLIVHWT